MNITIEKVTTYDAQELLNIYAPYVEETAISFEIEVPTLKEFRERIINISSKYPYIKAVCDGEIIGYAYAGSFHERAAYNWSAETTIYIRKDKRKCGVGQTLYTALENSCKNMGILNLNACIAYTEKEDEHLSNDSFHFHEKMGYKLVGTFHNSGYKFSTWYDMIWMEKMLDEHSECPRPVTFGNWSI